MSEKKHAFAEHLKQALTRNSKRIGSAAEFAPQLNLQTTGKPISTQAAHKWLMGTAMPVLDKIETLTVWLDVPLQ